MKVLVDSAFPVSVNSLANSYSIDFVRLTELIDDDSLVSYALENGYAGLVVFGDEMLASGRLRETASAANVLLICAVSTNPLDAETHLRSTTRSIASRLKHERSKACRLTSSGLSAINGQQ